jgi:hypothetical protein
MAEAPESSIAYLWRVEGGMWVVGVGGYQGRHPSLNDAQLMEFAEEVGGVVLGYFRDSSLG